MSTTDANGFMDRQHMFVMSSFQVEQLLRHSMDASQLVKGLGTRFRCMLDVGAGDGHVTMKLAHMADNVVATDVSPQMVSRLADLGFHAIETCDVSREALGDHARDGMTFDLVVLSNVLDCADRPCTLLQQIRDLVTPKTGRVLVAVVLPLEPKVEEGITWREPVETLPMESGIVRFQTSLDDGVVKREAVGQPPTWEQSLSQLVTHVLEPMGFHVETASRVPYISQGDWHTNYYVLGYVLLITLTGLLSTYSAIKIFRQILQNESNGKNISLISLS